MMPNRNSFVLIILLTLLQCFAPLLHAHTFGVGQDGGVHLYEVSKLHSGDQHAAHPHVIDAHGDESPAIGMVQEYRQDSAILLSNAVQPLLLLQSPQISSQPEQLPLDPLYAAPPGGSSSHFIPFSQAPPAAQI